MEYCNNTSCCLHWADFWVSPRFTDWASCNSRRYWSIGCGDFPPYSFCILSISIYWERISIWLEVDMTSIDILAGNIRLRVSNKCHPTETVFSTKLHFYTARDMYCINFIRLFQLFQDVSTLHSFLHLYHRHPSHYDDHE